MKRLLFAIVALLWAGVVLAQDCPDCPDGNCPTQPPIWDSGGIAAPAWGGSQPAPSRRPRQRMETPRRDTPVVQSPHTGPKNPSVAYMECLTAQRMPNGKEGRMCGTGTLIAKSVTGNGWGIVATVSHMFDKGTKGVVMTFPGRVPVKGKLLYDAGRDTGDDVAFVMFIGKPDIPCVTISETIPSPGDKYTTCGYGGDVNGYAERSGTIKEYVDYKIRGDSLVGSGVARQGDSGSPIFNEAGELCGVLRGTNPRMNITDGTHSDRLYVLTSGERGSKFPWNKKDGIDAPDPPRRGEDSPPLPPAPLLVDLEAEFTAIKEQLEALSGKVGVAPPELDEIKQGVEGMKGIASGVTSLQEELVAMQAAIAKGDKTPEEMAAMLESMQVVAGTLGKVSGDVAKLDALPENIRAVAAKTEQAANQAELSSKRVELLSLQVHKAIAAAKWVIGIPGGIGIGGIVWIAVFLYVKRDVRQARAGEDELIVTKIGNIVEAAVNRVKGRAAPKKPTKKKATTSRKKSTAK